ncbi:MAG: hypothetical protein JXA46_09310 [Dehalococcoidales bacterium]|nr:hypothetical protein [Dehalococcoidales bacterium]
MGKKSRKKWKIRSSDNKKLDKLNKYTQKVDIKPNINTTTKTKSSNLKKWITATVLEVFLWVGGELLGHVSPYFKAIAWIFTGLILMYFTLPLKKWLEPLLLKKYPSIRKSQIIFITLLPIILLGVLIFVFAFIPIVNSLNIKQPPNTTFKPSLIDQSHLVTFFE